MWSSIKESLGIYKPTYHVLTVWGLFIWQLAPGVLEKICSSGLMSTEHCTSATGGLEKIGIILTVLGVRKAVILSRPASKVSE